MPRDAKYNHNPNPKNKNKYNPNPERPAPVENRKNRGFRWKNLWKTKKMTGFCNLFLRARIRGAGGHGQPG